MTIGFSFGPAAYAIQFGWFLEWLIQLKQGKLDNDELCELKYFFNDGWAVPDVLCWLIHSFIDKKQKFRVYLEGAHQAFLTTLVVIVCNNSPSIRIKTTFSVNTIPIPFIEKHKQVFIFVILFLFSFFNCSTSFNQLALHTFSYLWIMRITTHNDIPLA